MSDTHERRGALRRSAATGVVMLALLALFAYLGSLRFSPGAQTRKDTAPKSDATRESKRGADAPKKTADDDAPTVKARGADETRRADAELARLFDRQLDEGEFARARWGVFVVSMRDGRSVYARNHDRLFTPASVLKVYTTAVALDMLGADYRWRTSVYAAREPDASGTIAGDLTLYGRGAPDLDAQGRAQSSRSLDALADELHRRGVRRVRGRIVGDESYFRGEALGSGWLWEDVQWYYGAHPSALTVGGNELTVSVAPGARTGEPVEVKLFPPTDYVRVTNEMKTSERGARPRIGVTRALSSNDVRLWGSFPAGGEAYGVRLSVHRPALWAAARFRDALRARGIEVAGEASARDARVADEERFDPSAAVELASVESRTLGETVRGVNKESINLEAELILRTLGRERGSQLPAAQPPGRERADDEAGCALIRLWLERAGIPTDGLALHDGSGLSRLDLVTPEATARLLARIAETPSASVYRASLPVAGRDGTLARRLRSTPAAASRQPVAAKTGSLTYTNTLAGYATTEDGEPLAFAIFCNDETGRASSTRVIDALVALLAHYPDFPAQDAEP